jgi:hypothetical protein
MVIRGTARFNRGVREEGMFSFRRTVSFAFLLAALIMAASCTPTGGEQPKPGPPDRPGGEQPPGADPGAPPAPPGQDEEPSGEAPGEAPEAEPSLWSNLSGTWSACVSSATAPACEEARGPFVTVYLEPTCEVGQACGSYVNGAFESEYVLYTLTLLELAGPIARMSAESDFRSDLNTTVEITRVARDLQLTPASGGSYRLANRCDPIIVANTTIGCSEYVP